MRANRRTLVMTAGAVVGVVLLALVIGQWAIATGNPVPAVVRWVLTAAGSVALLVGTTAAAVGIVRSARRGPPARTVFLSLALLAAVTALGALVGGPVGRAAVSVAGVPLIVGGIAVVVMLVTPMGWALMGAGLGRMQQSAAARAAPRQGPAPVAAPGPVHEER